MNIADQIYSGIKLSRCLDDDELDEFERIQTIKVDEITFIDNKVVTTGNQFYTQSKWEISSIHLTFPRSEEQSFFIETLLYLINDFFEPNRVNLNGYVLASDSIFGSMICIYVYNNSIYYLPDVVKYFEGLRLSDDYHTNHYLISQYMKNLIR